ELIRTGLLVARICADEFHEPDSERTGIGWNDVLVCVSLAELADSISKYDLAQALPPTAAQSDAAAPPKKGAKIAAALQVLVMHPEWEDARIAKQAGCSPSNLSQNPIYRGA